MTHILSVALEFEPHLAGGKAHKYAAEYSPYLHVHLTHALGVTDKNPDGIVVVPSSVVDTHTKTPGSLLQLELPISLASSPLPPSASLAVHTYVQTATETGQSCENHAGSAFFLLDDILSKGGASTSFTSSDADRVTHLDWEFTDPNAPLVKGVTSVVYAHVLPSAAVGSRSDASMTVSVSFAPPSARHAFHVDDTAPHVKQALTTGRTHMNKVLKNSLNIFFGPKATLSRSDPAYLKPVHFPYFQNDINNVPGSAFTLLRPLRPSDPDVWETAVRVALQRTGVSAHSTLAAVEKQMTEVQKNGAKAKLHPEFRYAMKTMVSALSVHANTMVYLDDFVNSGGKTLAAKVKTNGEVSLVAGGDVETPGPSTQEDYKNAFWGRAGDCEDLGEAIYVSHMDMLDAARLLTPQQLQNASTSMRLVKAFGDVLASNLYAPQLTGAAVTNKKLDADQRDLNEGEAMGHTYYSLIPTAKIAQGLSTGEENATVERVLSSKFWDTYARTYGERQSDTQIVPHAWQNGLDVLVGEGTSRADPFVLPVDTYYSTEEDKARARERYGVMHNAKVALLKTDGYPSVAGIEVPNYNLSDADGAFARDERDLSPFYKGNSALYTSVFKDVGVLDLALARDVSSERKLSTDATHGMRFTKFAQNVWTPDMRVVPYNGLSSDAMSYIEDTIAQLEPMPTLRRVDASSQTPSVPEQLQHIVRIINRGQTNVATTDGAVASDGMPFPPTHFSLQLRQSDATSDVLDNLARVVEQHKNKFTAAQASVHYLADAPTKFDKDDVPPNVIFELTLGTPAK